MNSRQIEAFRAILHYGTLTRAAEVLNVSQSALSQLLLRTEDQTGPLFERVKGRLVPTALARRLSPEVDRTYEDLERLRKLILDLRDADTAPIRIGASSPLMLAYVPILMRMINDGELDLRIEVAVNPVATIYANLGKGEYDLGLTMMPSSTFDLQTEVIGQTEMVCLLHEDHPLAERDTISIADLKDQPIISYRPSIEFGAAIARTFRIEGVDYRPVFEVDLSIAAPVFVQQALGVAVVEGASPWWRFVGIRQRPLVPRITMPICFVTNAHTRTSSDVEALEMALRRIVNDAPDTGTGR
ncbi:LysR family transcriptional regulator [Pukyongiella litopenaei]|uniref:LysR family transcriptional regulator n=1 Tax=Pukyongiella litopenaei TaxID=2605946 RepID=A0A5C2H421_9RHOB|nr:LysR family transcriptional regulator [Pukyongiella litopenaei]QEP30636.1 LysR family transcriptional regulator [Pukyongiella litopenaei]